MTIAFCSPESAFSTEDFPAFGLPVRLTAIPSRMYLPVFAVSSSLSVLSITSVSVASTNSSVSPETPSSGKSASLEIAAARYTVLSRISFIFSEMLPESWSMPFSRASSLFEWIMSITASLRHKSILPFKNARFVNSPARACLAPHSISESIIFLTAVIEP